jgi:arylsulfatase A-like enzyme/HEAT repeat protein
VTKNSWVISVVPGGQAGGQSMLRRTLLALSVGTWIGALAGLATALADFGAHWLFMESAGDRGWLLVRLLSTQPAAGAALGAAAGGVYAWTARPIAWLTARTTSDTATRARRERWARAALFSSLLTPLLWLVARLLFSGGKMSRLPHQPALIVSSAVLLTCGTALALFAAEHIVAWARTAAARSRRRASIALLVCAFALGKLDQLVLPNLYDYLHAVLSVVALAVYGLFAALMAVRAWDARRIKPPWLWSGFALGAVLCFGARWSLSTLDHNQNVRVALGAANLPHSRTLLLGITPWLPRVDRASAGLAKQRASAARRRRQQQQLQSDLPVLDDAHVLLITIDALRADHLGLHGYARHVTPELDALGARGVLFEHAYAQAPHSSYSLCSLMTSEYLHETLELGQSPPTATLPRVLTAAGYHTAAFYTQGIFHTAGEQLASYEQDAFGFALHEHQDRPAEQMTDRVLAEIDRTVTRGEPSALFWVHYFDVHEPYEATTLGTTDMDRYDSELLATDRAIGRLVRTAQQRLTKPLVVVITADHGEEFHEHGGVYHGSSLYEEQVHVPLIMIVPGVAPARAAVPVESIDISPTLFALLGIERPASVRGSDLRPVFVGRSIERGPVFSAVIHKKMVVSWPYKLIADLRFGTFELYDLAHDPGERDNRADRDGERLRSMRGEVYAWLDALTPLARASSKESLALEWGRLGDRRAVEPLRALLVNEAAAAATRTEAARLLGKLADPTASESLFAATHSPNGWVSAEAAIALGRMFDPRAASQLRRLVSSEDPGLRSRAAVSLGRLRDPAAVPSLIDALWVAPNPYEREEAVRWLGRLRDVRALDPLLNLLSEPHTRHLVVIAIGELGDVRAFAPLTDVLAWDRNTNVRDGAVRGLGMLEDPRALAVILPLVSDDPALRNTGESLVRLHALDSQSIGGLDLEPSTAAVSGFARCHRGPLRHDWDYLHRTYCTTERDHATLQLNVPRSVARASQGLLVLLSVKRADSSASAPLDLVIGGQTLAAVQVDGAWSEVRWNLPPNALRPGQVRAQLRLKAAGARLHVDHLLLVPRTSSEPPQVHGG